MILLKQKHVGLILLLILTGLSHYSFTQTVEIKGKVKKDNKPSAGVSIQISGIGITTQTITSKENGSFSFILDLQKNYSITFSKAGLVSKIIEFNTKLPPDQADIIYLYPFNLDLFDDLGLISNAEALSKPVARIAYDPTYENFMDDQNYTKKIKAEQELKRKAIEEIHRQKEKVRLDSLNKIWNDSLAKVKSRENQSMSDKAQQDRLRIEKEKARQDSIVKANTAAQAAAKEKDRLEAEAKQKEKQKQEAELAANMAAKERQKVIADSTQKAQANAKALADSKAKEESDRLEAAAKLKEKQKQEAELASNLAAKEKQKAIADSTQKAQANAKALADGKAKEESDRLEAEAKLKEKQKQDSVANVQRLQKEKAEQERQTKALAEIEAKKLMLAKANKVEEKVAPLPKTAPIPKIRDSDYREGVTDETINESNRIIYRTVVKKEGSTFNYQKIVYGWGGIFYFKNENSITEISFDQDIKNAKGEVK